METQPQNPEFRIILRTFTHAQSMEVDKGSNQN